VPALSSSFPTVETVSVAPASDFASRTCGGRGAAGDGSSYAHHSSAVSAVTLDTVVQRVPAGGSGLSTERGSPAYRIRSATDGKPSMVSEGVSTPDEQ
jgi:hypothetical protein